MEDILGTLQALQDTPVPNLLVIAGFVFLLLAFVGKIGAVVQLPEERQKWAGIAGSLLLVFGIGLFMVPTESLPPPVSPDTPPTAIPQIPPTNTPVPPTILPSPEQPTNTPVPTDTPKPTASPTPTVSPEQAIRDYYSFIEQKQYAVAWEMSYAYNIERKGLSLDTYASEWEKSGPATIVDSIDVVGNNNEATVTLTLYYPTKNVHHRLRYELVRDVERGHPRFGYWLFVKGTMLY